MSYKDTFDDKCLAFKINKYKDNKELLKKYFKIRIIFEDGASFNVDFVSSKRFEMLTWLEDNFHNDWIWSANLAGEWIDFYFFK